MLIPRKERKDAPPSPLPLFLPINLTSLPQSIIDLPGRRKRCHVEVLEERHVIIQLEPMREQDQTRLPLSRRTRPHPRHTTCRTPTQLIHEGTDSCEEQRGVPMPLECILVSQLPAVCVL